MIIMSAVQSCNPETECLCGIQANRAAQVNFTRTGKTEFMVISRKGEDSPVYEVKPETGPGGAQILHRNLLLPCNHLPVQVASKTPHREKSRKETRRETNHVQVYQLPGSPYHQ